MSVRKYTSAVLDSVVNTLGKTSSVKTSDFSFDPKEGMLYVEVRAISARVNRNFDGFPSSELRRAAHTFEGRPVFVNHKNDDEHRTRGMILKSMYKESGEDKYIKLLIEVDAQNFPKLASAIVAGDVDAVSMGTDCTFTICSVCDNKAYNYADFCKHIPAKKGKTAYREDGDQVLVYESCYGLNFFEISFVFDPADETAILTNVVTAGVKTSSLSDVILNVDASYVAQDDVRPGPMSAQFYARGTAEGIEEFVNLYPKSFGWYRGGGSSSTQKFWHFLPNGVSGDTNESGLKKAIRALTVARSNGVNINMNTGTLNAYKDIDEALKAWDDLLNGRTASTKEAYGETVAPTKVDTLRQEEPCPQCGQLVDDNTCPMCGYEKPMGGLGDPNTDTAKEVDLRQENGDEQVEIAEDGGVDPNQETDLGAGEDPVGAVDKAELGNRVQTMDQVNTGAGTDEVTDTKVVEDDSDEKNAADPDDVADHNKDGDGKLPTIPEEKKKKVKAAFQRSKIAKLMKAAGDADPTPPSEPDQPGEPDQPSDDLEWAGEEDNKTASVEDLVLISYKVGSRFVGEVIDEEGVLISQWFKNASEAQSFTAEFATDVVKLAAAPVYQVGDKAEFFTLDQPGAPWIWKPVTITSVETVSDKGHQSIGFTYDNEYAKNGQQLPGSVRIGPRGGGKEFRLR